MTKAKTAYLLGIGLVLAVAVPGVVGVAAAHWCRAATGDTTHPTGCDPHDCSNSGVTATNGPMLPEPEPVDLQNDVLPLLPPLNPLSIPMTDAGPLREAAGKAAGQVFGLPNGLVPGDGGTPGVPGGGEGAPWHWHTVTHANAGDTYKHHCASWGAMAGVDGIIPV